MTKEERAAKWFRKIPKSEKITMERKMKICEKVSRKMLVTFLIMLAVEWVLVFLVNDGAIFTQLADTLNNFASGNHSRNHYRGMSLIGGALVAPFIIVPIAIVALFRNSWIKAEMKRYKR